MPAAQNALLIARSELEAASTPRAIVASIPRPEGMQSRRDASGGSRIGAAAKASVRAEAFQSMLEIAGCFAPLAMLAIPSRSSFPKVWT
jgi:hypothetical protein